MTVSREAALVAYRAFSDVAGKGAFFLVTVFAARGLSQHGFGIFSLGTTIGWMAAVLTDFGIQLHVAREVAQRPDEAPRLLRAWLRIRVCTTAIAFAALSLGLLTIGAARDDALAILLLALVYLVNGLVEFLHYFYRGLSRSDVESTLTLWQRFGVLACATGVLAWRPDVSMLAVAMLVPVVATLAYSLRRAARMADAQEIAPVAANTAEPAEAAHHAHEISASSAGSAVTVVPLTRAGWQHVVPIGLGLVFSSLYFRIDVFLIEIWSGTNAVALYNAVFRVVDALRLFPAAVLAVGLPALVRATDARPLWTVSAIVTAFSVVVSVVLAVAAEWLVPFLYGARYAEAVPAFRILLASLPLMSLNYALTHQLVGWNGHRAWAAISAAALVFNVALNARLIPAMSIAGAAWATLATELLLTLACAAALRVRSSRLSAGPLTATASS